ncbi:MAG: hypothetical protein ACFE8L_06055 [Candidatus Hodarchaeota archaeon]
MKFKINKKISVILAVFTLLLIILNITVLDALVLHKNNVSKIIDNDNIHIAARKDWFDADFTTQGSWFSEVEGDNRDISTSVSQGFANYIIIGDSGNTNIDSSLSDTDWTVFNNPELPILPDIYEINSSGCYVYHEWHEDVNQTRNRPSIHWKRTITMPVNMTDYVITSASLEVIFNATVTVSPHNGGGIDRLGDANLDDYSTGDYAKFYVLFSDEEESFEPIQAAHNNTALGDLGQDSPAVSNFPDTPLNTVPENVLISILTSVLGTDGYNFTITLGIDIYCEDNEEGVDIDRWNSLIIRSFNLTFSYEKKIDQFTAASWNNIGEELENSTNIRLDSANLRFVYKVDQLWPDLWASYPNSEIRFSINDKQYIETIKLSSALTYPQEAKPGGFDVTSLITKGINISLSIQVFLADTFELSDNITVSIDNVRLRIYYTNLSGKSTEEPFINRILFIAALIIAAGLGGYLYLYQKILKYPKPVRKVRKYRFSLKKKKGPDVSIVGREKAFNVIYASELSKTSGFLKVRPKEQVIEPTPKTTSGAPSKTSQGIKS